MQYQVKTPVLMIVFNRPETTKKVFERVREVKPKKLYIAADAPRDDNNNDNVRCKQVKDIFHQVDWECEVHTNYAEKNMGCSKRPHTAISWALEKEERIIVLEDDCFPEIEFFRFCDELLEKYQQDERIMLISGTNYYKKWDTEYSYLFSRYLKIWGWATWKRAWDKYDINIKLWENQEAKELLKEKLSKRAYREDVKRYDYLLNGENRTTAWDYQWEFCMLTNSGMSIVPAQNLVRNIGFGEGATHTFDLFCKFSNIESYEIEFPLKHPPFVMPNTKYDKKFMKDSHTPTILYMVYYKIRTVLLKIIKGKKL